MLPLLILAPLVLLIALNLPLGDVQRKLAWPLAMLLAVAQSVLVAVFPLQFRVQGEYWLSKTFYFPLQGVNLSLVLLLSTGLVMLAVLLTAKAMMPDVRRRFNFINVLLIALAGMNGIVLVRDIFTLYVFMEIISISSFILIAFGRDKLALEGAFKYLVLSAVASVLMISAVALMMLLGGGTSFDAVRSALASESPFGITRIAIAAFLCGLFIKAGLVPFHGWLPAAYSAAPAPTSIFLAGIATKATGVYALIRLVTDVFPPSQALGQVLMLIGAVSIVVGALAAIGQKDMKRLLAYSSISQIGYIVLGLGCGAMPGIAPSVAALAIWGAIFHLFNHAIFKSLLFVNSASLEQQLGTTELARMGGLSKNMPVTNWTNVVAILSTAGIPPLSGFWSKLLIVIALWQAGFQTYAFLAVGFSVVTLAYLLLIQRRVFFGKLPEELAEVSEASGGLVFASVFLAALTLAVGVLMPLVLNSLQSLK